MLTRALLDFFLAGMFYWFAWYTYDLIRTGIGPHTALLVRGLLRFCSVMMGMFGIFWLIFLVY